MRLGKIAKDFNVGVQTLIEFIEKRTGVTVEGGPNFNVSDDHYALLSKEFNKDKSVKQESERERQERQQTREKIKEETKVQPSRPSVARTPSEEKLDSKLKVVGVIDLNQKPKSEPQPEQPKQEVKPQTAQQPVQVQQKQEPTPEPKPQPEQSKQEVKQEVKPQPVQQPVQVQQKPEQPKQEVKSQPVQQAETKKPNQTAMGERSKERFSEDPLPEEARNGEIFRLNSPSSPTINVVGTIDLESLNQSTRPKKKSKEERRKEREQKSNNGGNRHQRGAQKVDINEEISRSNGRNSKNDDRRDKKSRNERREENRENRENRENQKNKHSKKGNNYFKQEISEED